MIPTNLFTKVPHLKKQLNNLPEGKCPICTDSRRMEKGQAFVAIKGANFDSFDFIEKTIQSGAVLIVYNSNLKNDQKITQLAKSNSSVAFIGVEDTTSFLGHLASEYLQYWKKQGDKKVITLTGSNGKTTTKEMLFHLLDQIFPGEIHATSGNFNNHIGLPLTILNAKDQHSFMILEIGTNHPGEIASLCRIISPTIGMITNIGKSHLEFFKDEQGVFNEKTSLFHAIEKSTGPEKIFLINGNDDYLNTLSRHDFCKSIGKHPSCDYQVDCSFNGASIKMPKHQKIISISNVNLIGDYNYFNLSMAWAMSWELLATKIDQLDKVLTQAATSFIPSQNRSVLLKNKQNGYLFMDAYNANPSSMKKALEGFCTFLKNLPANDYQQKSALDECLFILGDMNELGSNASIMHQEMGNNIRELGICNICFVGQYCHEYQKGFTNTSWCFKDTAQLKEKWIFLQKKYLHFFIKGSRTLQLESIVSIK